MADKYNPIIQRMDEHHVEQVTRMALILWPDCDPEEEYNYFLNLCKSPGQVVFVASFDTELIAFIQLSLRTDHVEGTNSSPVTYIEGIYVEPGYRTQGIANTLVATAEKWGTQHQCTEIASDAEIDNTSSIAFHKAVGFTEANRVVCFAKRIGG